MRTKKLLCFLFIAFLLLTMSAAALADSLVPGGQALGIKMETAGVIVSELQSVSTADGEKSPAADAGLMQGDIIVKLGKSEIKCAQDFISAATALSGNKTTVTVSRDGKLKQFNLTPALCDDGSYKLGLMLRDGVSGVGTLTFYDPETGVYGALGHSISDASSGRVLPLSGGSIMSAEIKSVIPGQAGTPGELNGDTEESSVLGDIRVNCVCGIFGIADLSEENAVETGALKTGKASIYCTVSGNEVKEYSISVDRVSETDGYTVAKLHVTDPELLSLTGGIVQGMSGSPIIQDGHLVGAVTHVFVNDPAGGYGISIQDMIKAAESAAKAA